MPHVLVNADDFGLHADIDRGILDCIDGGVLQSLSFCPNGKTIDWNKLKELTRAGVRVGLHVTLVGEPWLTDGRVIPHWKSLVKQILAKGEPFREMVAGEIQTQLALSQDNGITLSHIDSHQHVHVFPGVWKPCLSIAQRLQIRIRIPRAPTMSAVKKNIAGMGLQSLAAMRARRVSDYLPCLGLSLAGHNTAGVLIRELTASVGAGDLELVAHPGVNTPDLERTYADWHFDWTGERNALRDPHFAAKMNELGYTFMPLLSKQENEPRMNADERG